MRLLRRIPADGHDADELPTMGAAVAQRDVNHRPTPPPWLSSALEEDDENESSNNHRGAAGTQLLVNYSKFEQMKRETVAWTSATTVDDAGDSIRGRMIFLGDVELATDLIEVPGQHPVPGVYLLALAAYTLATEPLYEFKHSVRIMIDLAISIVIMAGAYQISRGRRSAAVQARRRGLFIYAAMGTVIVGGLLLVRFTHVMWLDFVLAPFAMLLHPKVEEWLAAHLKSRKRPERHHV